MTKPLLQVRGTDLVCDGDKVTLRGFGVGSWMNIEHFMFGMPGMESAIRRAFSQAYGPKNAGAFFESFLANVIGEADFALLRELGVNCLRLPFNYRHFEDDQHPYAYREEGFAHLDRVLALCAKHRIWAILDMHAVPGGQNPDWHCDNDAGMPLFFADASLRDRTVRLWKHIAARYAGHPFIAGYDIVNEPCHVQDRTAFNDFFRKTTEAIRKVDTNHILWIEGDDWGKDFSIFDDLQDEQTACSFHLYPGFYVNDETAPRAREILSPVLAPLFAIRERFQRPIWCGETASHNPTILRTMLDLLEENDCSWTLWAYKDVGTMGLVFPGPETPWRRFVARFPGRGEDRRIASEIAAFMTERGLGPLGNVDFRLRAIVHRLWVDNLVAPALSETPWDDVRTLPESFALSQCQRQDEILAIVRAYARR